MSYRKIIVNDKIYQYKISKYNIVIRFENNKRIIPISYFIGVNSCDICNPTFNECKLCPYSDRDVPITPKNIRNYILKEVL